MAKSVLNKAICGGIVVMILLIYGYIDYTTSPDSNVLIYGHIHIDYNNKSLSWCNQNFKSTGIGNRLSQYWIDRATAFWLNMTFTIDISCDCNMFTSYYFCNTERGKLSIFWTQFLPHHSQFTLESLLLKNKNIYNLTIHPTEYEKYVNLSRHLLTYFQEEISNNKDDEQFRHQHYKKIMLAVHNTLFIQIVQYDIKNAFNLYFEQRSFNKAILNEYKSIKDKYLENSLIIHFRCGDILNVKGSGSYGFAGFSYYRDAKNIWKLNRNNTINHQINIYVIINLNKKNARKRDKKNINSCIHLINLIKPGFDKLFENIGKVYIVGDGTINTDIYLITHAKYVICAVSTFCEMNVIGNTNNVIRRYNHNWIKIDNNFQYFPSNIKMLSISNRNLHPGIKINLTHIAQWIMSH